MSAGLIEQQHGVGTGFDCLENFVKCRPIAAVLQRSITFRAVPFEIWLTARLPSTPAGLLRNACMMSAIAAAIDYGATPKRLTPGWELVLSKRAMMETYGAMALGLAGGALVAHAWFGEHAEPC